MPRFARERVVGMLGITEKAKRINHERRVCEKATRLVNAFLKELDGIERLGLRIASKAGLTLPLVVRGVLVTNINKDGITSQRALPVVLFGDNGQPRVVGPDLEIYRPTPDGKTLSILDVNGDIPCFLGVDLGDGHNLSVTVIDPDSELLERLFSPENSFLKDLRFPENSVPVKNCGDLEKTVQIQVGLLPFIDSSTTKGWFSLASRLDLSLNERIFLGEREGGIFHTTFSLEKKVGLFSTVKKAIEDGFSDHLDRRFCRRVFD